MFSDVSDWRQITSIWVCDTEFIALPGEHPEPVCLVATEIFSGQTVRLWRHEMTNARCAPFDCGQTSLFVAYYASAELSVFKACGWAIPINILDLFVEFRLRTNGAYLPFGNGLLGALQYFGMHGMTTEDKDSNRDLIMRGGPWSDEERQRILNYCEEDVSASKQLFLKMQPGIDLKRALYFRGTYCKAVAEMEYTGVPVDVVTLSRIQKGWEKIKDKLIARVNQIIPVYQDNHFVTALFVRWLSQNGIAWPLLDSGGLALDEETFSEMAEKYPQVGLLKELRINLSKLRTNDLTIGSDGRNRVMLSPFSSKTGRNQPSTTRNIFGGSKWLRSLITPKPGKFLCYIDWSSQEIGIAAKLSNDPNLMEAYRQDPYIWFARHVGAVPRDATKSSHKLERAIYKETMLAVGYGMGVESLAAKINQPVARARTLLMQHRETFPRYWAWNNAAVNHALARLNIHTRSGWILNVDDRPKVTSLQNWPMQANGADIMRMAACMMVEAGLKICCPVHDAFLVEGLVGREQETISEAQKQMARASAFFLDGFELRSEAEIIMPGERLHDERGRLFYQMIMDLLQE